MQQSSTYSLTAPEPPSWGCGIVGDQPAVLLWPQTRALVFKGVVSM